MPIADFEQFYRSAADPYRMTSRWYEERKRAITVAALPRERYERGLEIACGEGALTVELAHRVDALVATEGSPTALGRARSALATFRHVELVEQVLPADPPPGPFDLVVFSEIGYFLDEDDLRRTRDGMRRVLAADGDLVSVHWRHASPDYPLDGPRVHACLGESDDLEHVAGHREGDFVLDVWRKRPTTSDTRV